MPMNTRVRRAVAGDETTLRTLRLQALSDAPAAFSSTYEREDARTLADWRRWLSPGATFIVDESDEPRGLVAGVHDHRDREIVHLMAMWVHPASRRSGAADALIAAVAAWAAQEGALEIRLHIVKGNERARRCYERNGFRATGCEVQRDGSRVVEVEMTRLVQPGITAGQ